MKHKFISRILTIVLSVVAVSGLASCGTKKIEYIDDQSVRLNLDYKGKVSNAILKKLIQRFL